MQETIEDYTKYTMRNSDKMLIKEQAFEQIEKSLENIIDHNWKVRREDGKDIKYLEQTGMLAEDLGKDILEDIKDLKVEEGNYEIPHKRWKYYMQQLNAIAKSGINMFKEQKFVIVNNSTGKPVTKNSKVSPENTTKHLDLQRIIYKDDFKEVYGISTVIAMSISFLLNDVYMHNIEMGRGVLRESLLKNTEEE